MKITPTSLTINQLLSSGNEQFFIPAYQRRYAWEWKQIKELYDDIYYLKETDTHLLGSMVCLTLPHVAGVNKLEVVDGQQRITSLSLFLEAIKDRYEELKDKEAFDEIQSLLKCKGIDRVLHNKVLLGDLDNPDYKRVIDYTELDEIRNEKILKAYDWFKEWIYKLDHEQLNSIYYKLLNNVLVIRLDVADAKDAYKLFETINNRGLKLSATDILKNFLLGHASSIDNPTLEKVRENWKQIIINLDGINDGTDDFFRHYMCGILKRKVTFTYLTDEFKKYYVKNVREAENLTEYVIYNKVDISQEDTLPNEVEDEEDINESEAKNNYEKEDGKISIIEFSDHLKKSSLIYSKLRNRSTGNKKIDQHIFNLQRIKSFPAYIFLLDLFSRVTVNDEDKKSILKLLETFMLRRHICEYRTGELDDIFSTLVELQNENIVEDVKTSLKKDLPTDEEFQSKFKHANFKGNENRAKYILEKYEYRLMGDTGELEINSGRDVHLEHIIPKTIFTKKSKNEYGDWEAYLGEESQYHKQFVNLIGNFTLLGQKLNIVASNNPFEDKLEEYRKSAINLTKKIVVSYDEFRSKEVYERCEDFAEKAADFWNFNES